MRPWRMNTHSTRDHDRNFFKQHCRLNNRKFYFLFTMSYISIYRLKIVFCNLFKSLQSVYTISCSLMNRAIITLNFNNQATRSKVTIIVHKFFEHEGNTEQFVTLFDPIIHKYTNNSIRSEINENVCIYGKICAQSI